MAKILLVEDDRLLAEAYKDGIERAGFGVVVANDGEEGLKMLESEKPDLVLLDLIMPVKNGYEFLKQVKFGIKFKEMPVIVLTVLNDEKDIEEAKKLGADDYIVKSATSLEDSITKITLHLSKKDAATS